MFGLLNDPDFVAGIFSFFVVAILIALFELFLFKFIVLPIQSEAVKKMITNLTSKSSSAKRSDTFNLFASTDVFSSLDATHKTIEQREQELINTIHNDSFAIFLLIIVALCMIALILFVRLRKLNPMDRKWFWVPICINITVTIIALAVFQYFVFLYAEHVFKFPGDDEIIYRSISKIKTDLKIS